MSLKTAIAKAVKKLQILILLYSFGFYIFYYYIRSKDIGW